MLIVIAKLGMAQPVRTKVARLSDHVPSFTFYTEDSVLCTLSPNQLFHYYPKTEHGSIKFLSGFNISKENVTIIDSIQYLKFKFESSGIYPDSFAEDGVFMREAGYNYDSLIERSLNTDTGAFKKIISLISETDGAGAESMYARIYRILHFWKDEDVLNMLQNSSPQWNDYFKIHFYNEGFVYYLNIDIVEYMQYVYPKSAKLLPMKKYEIPYQDINERFILTVDSIKREINTFKSYTDTNCYVFYKVKNNSRDTLKFVTNSCFYYNQSLLEINGVKIKLNRDGACSFNALQANTIPPGEFYIGTLWITAEELNYLDTGKNDIILSIPMIKNQDYSYKIDGRPFVKDTELLIFEGEIVVILNYQFLPKKKRK